MPGQDVYIYARKTAVDNGTIAMAVIYNLETYLRLLIYYPSTKSSSCHRTFRFHCSVHLYYISFNFRSSSKVQGCVKREHRKICTAFSASRPHEHVVSPLK